MTVKFSDIIQKFWKSEGQEDLTTPIDEKVTFGVFYKTLPIGELTLSKGLWTFSYAQMFKQQNEIKPIVDFPDVNKQYKSEGLFPFFIHRIPSLSQPKVQATIKKEDIDKNNEVEMLKRFGEYAITNPFRVSLIS